MHRRTARRSQTDRSSHWIRAKGHVAVHGAFRVCDVFLCIRRYCPVRVEGAPKRGTGGWHNRNIVFTLVERGGSARSFHIDGKAIADFMPIIRANVARESRMNTDEAKHYYDLSKEFAGGTA
jgi:hypothetical protein